MDAAFELFPKLAGRRRQAAGTMSGGEREAVVLQRREIVKRGLRDELRSGDELQRYLAP